MNWIASYRLSIFVPETNLDSFLAQITPHIPAFLGGYDSVCWFSEPGVEQYRKKGEKTLHQTPSIRVELSMLQDQRALDDFIQNRVIPAHPWEEPVIIVQETRIHNHTAK